MNVNEISPSNLYSPFELRLMLQGVYKIDKNHDISLFADILISLYERFPKYTHDLNIGGNKDYIDHEKYIAIIRRIIREDRNSRAAKELKWIRNLYNESSPLIYASAIVSKNEILSEYKKKKINEYFLNTLFQPFSSAGYLFVGSTLVAISNIYLMLRSYSEEDNLDDYPKRLSVAYSSANEENKTIEFSVTLKSEVDKEEYEQGTYVINYTELYVWWERLSNNEPWRLKYEERTRSRID